MKLERTLVDHYLEVFMAGIKLSGAKSGHAPDFFLIAVLVVLILLGILVLASASSDLGRIKFGDSFYYLKHQLFNGLLPGLIGVLLAYFVPYQKYKKIALFALIFNILLLIAVFVPSLGLKTGGSTRWLNLGFFSFQPAEFLKIFYIVYVAALVSGTKFTSKIDFKNNFLPFFLVTGILAGLLLIQPATSTVAILVASALAVYFMGGVPWKYVLAVMAIGLVIVSLLILPNGYRRDRIFGYLNPDSGSQSINYHRNQALIAIGSGELTGMGYGKSIAKMNYLPEVVGDSIFAVLAQELGFIGAGFVVMLFVMLIVKLLLIAKNTRDKFGRYILIGFAAVIACQTFVNMGSISGILPMTGVPLPFLSYGGTALAIFMTMGGIAINVSKYSG